MTFAEKMKGLAKAAGKNLVLAEGLEPRTVRAARKIADEKIAASVTLVGNEEKVRLRQNIATCLRRLLQRMGQLEFRDEILLTGGDWTLCHRVF